MKLETISISDYRSITSTEKIRLDRTTVLIGPNNEGKSNILRALVLAMTILTRGRIVRNIGRSRRVGYNIQGFKWEFDYPIGKQRRHPDGETEIILEFSLTDSERADFQAEVKSRITGLLPLKFSIGKNAVSVKFHKKGPGSKSLSSKHEKIAEFVHKRLEFEHIPAVRTAESALEIVYDLVSRELQQLEGNTEYAKAIGEIERLQSPILKDLSTNITATLKTFLPQVKKVEIGLSMEQRFAAFRGATVSVDDGTMTSLEYKGDGVQSLAALALIRHASAKSGKGKSFIIAIEEPESHLHPKAIHELKGVIDQLGQEHQVIITSHNPLFVDRRAISSNIIVNRTKAVQARHVREIRDVLGVRASDNLRNAEMVLVVEGEDDESSIRALLRHSSDLISRCLDNGTLVLDSLHGATNLSYKLSLLRDSLCLFHVFLDNDKSGIDAFKKARNAGLLEDGQVNYARALGKTESELEDLFDTNIYKDSLESKFRVSLGSKPFRGRGKWSDRIKDVFVAAGKHWDDQTKRQVKSLVSEHVVSSPGNAIAYVNKPAFDGLVQALSSRLSERGSG